MVEFISWLEGPVFQKGLSVMALLLSASILYNLYALTESIPETARLTWKCNFSMINRVTRICIYYEQIHYSGANGEGEKSRIWERLLIAHVLFCLSILSDLILLK